MRNISLADGTVYPVDRCGAADGRLRVRILPPYVITDVVSRFTDPVRTRRIEHYIDGSGVDHQVYEGYTEFVAMEIDQGKLLIIMHEAAQAAETEVPK